MQFWHFFSAWSNGWYIEDITWPRGDTKFLFECWKIFHEHERHKKRNFVSPSGHVMFYLFYYINTNELPNHFTLIGFWCERRDLLFSHIAMVIFSQTVKITCYFPMRRYQVFAWKLTWYFIGVYIINLKYVCEAIANWSMAKDIYAVTIQRNLVVISFEWLI